MRPLFQYLTTAVVMAVSPMALHAACFDTSDLGRGLVVTFEDGNQVFMQRTGTGDVAVRETYNNDDYDTLYTGPYGLYFREEVDVLNGVIQPASRLQIDFSVGDSFPPEPAIGVSWSGPTVNIWTDGNTRDEIYSVKISDKTTYDISGCTYEALIAQVRYEWPNEGGGFGLEYAYLPAIGSAFLLSSAVDDGSIPPNVPASLERMSK
ncbi:hypothetical protein [Yoonia sp. 208BN28-4]|uniref:hypothetical protein n=1 Tax=Yoonia sp. 208BN28-4 TaxID=3126505 RepID=UPI00309E4D22